MADIIPADDGGRPAGGTVPAAADDEGQADPPPRVVALGGGHGLHASLSALRRVTTDVTAVVTVADDGGSSGRLRRELGVLPPGDLSMAQAALCGDDEWGHTWREVVQHRSRIHLRGSWRWAGGTGCTPRSRPCAGSPPT